VSSAERRADWAEVARLLERLSAYYLSRIQAPAASASASSSSSASTSSPASASSPTPSAAPAPASSITISPAPSASTSPASASASTPAPTAAASAAAITGYRSALKRLGIAYKYQHQLSASLRTFERIAQFEQSLANAAPTSAAAAVGVVDTRALCTAWSNAGLVCEQMKQLERALGFYELCRAMEEKTQDLQGLASTYLNIGQSVLLLTSLSL
jgi:hypothetical protein